MSDHFKAQISPIRIPVWRHISMPRLRKVKLSVRCFISFLWLSTVSTDNSRFEWSVGNFTSQSWWVKLPDFTPKRKIILRTIRMSLTLFWLSPLSSFSIANFCTCSSVIAVASAKYGRRWFWRISEYADIVERLTYLCLSSRHKVAT